jgi:hypothetical protein
VLLVVGGGPIARQHQPTKQQLLEPVQVPEVMQPVPVADAVRVGRAAKVVWRSRCRWDWCSAKTYECKSVRLAR